MSLTFGQREKENKPAHNVGLLLPPTIVTDRLSTDKDVSLIWQLAALTKFGGFISKTNKRLAFVGWFTLKCDLILCDWEKRNRSILLLFNRKCNLKCLQIFTAAFC